MAAPFLPILGTLLPAIGNVLDRLIPDTEARSRVAAELQHTILTKEAELQKAAAEIVRAEARSEHWVTATWRPILMLVFGGLIVARFLGYTAPGIGEAELVRLWSILEVGIGGYVIGRTAEKVVPQVAEAVSSARRK